ncbi:MAG: hypothetical protein JW795_02455 [Chitinivibrionales bacterium]|nr:hypothetical protein [Chitinivibrionales bacterium]
MRTLHQKITMILFICCLCVAASSEQKVIFSEPWNKHFSLGRSETGETMAVSALFYHDSLLFLYDLAQRRLGLIDTNGRFVRCIELATIGRNTYVGDDFIIRNSEAIFLNSVDKKLELFSMENGSHTASIPYPADALKSEPKRSRRLISKIYPLKDGIGLASDYALFPYSLISRQITPSSNEMVRSPHESKIIFFDGTNMLLLNRNNRVSINAITLHNSLPVSSVPITGKRFGLSANALYILSVTTTQLSLLRIPVLPR